LSGPQHLTDDDSRDDQARSWRIHAWHDQGTDVDCKIAVPATYLGHVEVGEVYWYLSAVPELMYIVAG